jgi:hypothetical protein
MWNKAIMKQYQCVRGIQIKRNFYKQYWLSLMHILFYNFNKKGVKFFILWVPSFLEDIIVMLMVF